MNSIQYMPSTDFKKIEEDNKRREQEFLNYQFYQPQFRIPEEEEDSEYSFSQNTKDFAENFSEDTPGGQETNSKETQETEIPKEVTTPTIKYDKNDFISKMTSLYEKVLKEKNINPIFARRLAVQDALETNYGNSVIGKFNYGNITAPNRNTSATEGKDKDANGNSISQRFRNYLSDEDYVNHKVDLLNSSRYHAFDGDESGFYGRVKAGGYATAKDYVQNLDKLYGQIFSAKLGGKLTSFKNDFPNNTPRGLKVK